MKKSIFYFLPMIALAGCTSSDLTGDQREPVIVGDQEIVLSSGVGEQPVADSRAVINNALPTAGLDVAIIRLDETGDPKAFPAWNTVTTANDVLSAHVDATSKQVAFNDGATPPVAKPQYYLANGNQTRLQGFHPKDGTVAAGVITWTIDGSNDIMVSNYADGDKTAKFGSSKMLTFEHLLTQIIVKAYGTSEGALDNWGNIKKISIKNQNLTCKYTLADGATVGTAAFSGKTGTSHLPIIMKKTDDTSLSPDYAADGSGLAFDYNNDKTKATVCGYAMFEPAAANTVTLIIETAEGGTIEKPITQKLEKGYAYNVILKFTTTDIVPEVAISAWKTGSDIEVEL